MLIFLLSLVLAAAPETVSMDFQDADIHTVLRFLAETGHINIVVADDVKGSVTLRLKDVRWEDALTAILAAKGLTAVRLDGSIIVQGHP